MRRKLPWVVIVVIMGMVLSHICMVTQADEGTDPEPERDNGLFRLGLYANVTIATVKPPLGQYSFSVQVVDESLFAAFGWTHRRVELEIIDVTGLNWVYGLSNTRFFLAHNEVRSINLTAGAGPNASFFSTCTLHAQMLDEPIGNSWHHEYLTFSLMVAPFHALSLELEKRVFEKGQDEKKEGRSK